MEVRITKNEVCICWSNTTTDNCNAVIHLTFKQYQTKMRWRDTMDLNRHERRKLKKLNKYPMFGNSD